MINEYDGALIGMIRLTMMNDDADTQNINDGDDAADDDDGNIIENDEKIMMMTNTMMADDKQHS